MPECSDEQVWSPEALERAAALLGVLAHPGRLAVLLHLRRHGACAAGDLGRAVGLEASALSHQLRLLREVDLVRAEKQGRHVIYNIADQHVAHIVHDALAHVNERQAR